MAINEDFTKAYSREEREAQIAAVHHLSRKTQKNYLLRPKSLIDALAKPEPLSAAEIRALVEVEYSSPVTSLYLRMDPENTAPQGKALVRFFHSLKTRALEEQKGFIEALPKARKEILNDDLKELEVLLEQYFVPAGPRPLIIFKCGEQLNRVFRLPAWTIDAMVIGGDPHVAPLEAVLEENEKVLFVEVSVGESRLLVMLARSYNQGCYLEAMRSGALDYLEGPLGAADIVALLDTFMPRRTGGHAALPDRFKGARASKGRMIKLKCN